MDGLQDCRRKTARRGSAVVDQIKRDYPEGTIVELISMDDAQAPPAGTKGTVKGVDDIGTIHVAWDTGSTLGLIPGVDQFRKMAMRFCDSIRDLDRSFTPRTRGISYGDEVDMMRASLRLKNLSNKELCHMRNAVVVYYDHYHELHTDMVAMDKLSAITNVIDREKWDRGMEV